MPHKWPEIKRQTLLDFVRAGNSCRKAAAQVGVSAATAVRWARAAKLSGPAPHRLAPATRAALIAALAAGSRPAEAARTFQVSPGAARRLAPAPDAYRASARAALFAKLSEGLSRRRAAAKLGLSVATAIRWARDFDPMHRVPNAPRPRRPTPSRYRPDHESKQAELLAAIDSGLSKRRAAAVVGLPVATAIRWASRRDKA